MITGTAEVECARCHRKTATDIASSGGWVGVLAPRGWFLVHEEHTSDRWFVDPECLTPFLVSRPVEEEFRIVRRLP